MIYEYTACRKREPYLITPTEQDNGCYEKNMKLFFEIGKFYGKLLWKRSDLLQNVTD